MTATVDGEIMEHKCKRIIDGKTYNTETATRIGGYDEDNGPYEQGLHLYQTRLGVFFEYSYYEGHGEDDYERITPLTPNDAQRWLEKHQSWNPEKIEELFGEMPEPGSGEVKFTLRMPESLRNRLAARAEANKQSLNAWMVRCLEGCAGGDE
ncbi:toxin-antitoxin system HicB family antitoxin [Agrobacterium sp. ICMP 7243]|nr:toxin-antitoxin system HicB family antitoxin [Agrobacterium sp. ICMP 7243]